MITINQPTKSRTTRPKQQNIHTATYNHGQVRHKASLTNTRHPAQCYRAEPYNSRPSRPNILPSAVLNPGCEKIKTCTGRRQDEPKTTGRPDSYTRGLQVRKTKSNSLNLLQPCILRHTLESKHQALQYNTAIVKDRGNALFSGKTPANGSASFLKLHTYFEASSQSNAGQQECVIVQGKTGEYCSVFFLLFSYFLFSQQRLPVVP